MIEALSKLDKLTAAGLLARTALSIRDGDMGDPAIPLTLPDERALREAVLEEVRQKIGVAPGDNSEEALERLEEALDTESESLVGPTNSLSALDRLALRGELPSDLFEVQIHSEIERLHGLRYEEEERLILETVKAPDQQQHFGIPKEQGQHFLISLFAKRYQHKFGRNSFTMLVAAQRKRMTLEVIQAWRIYLDKVDVVGARDLMDVLRRFAGVYGVDLEYNGESGPLIVAATLPAGTPLETTFRVEAPPPGKKRLVNFSYFAQPNADAVTKSAALVIAIDVDRYRRQLAERRE